MKKSLLRGIYACTFCAALVAGPTLLAPLHGPGPIEGTGLKLPTMEPAYLSVSSNPTITTPALPETMRLSQIQIEPEPVDPYTQLAVSKKAQPLVKLLRTKYDVSKEQAKLLIATVYKYSILRKIDPHILLGIIKVESTFNPLAVSEGGARGLMQVMASVHKRQVARQGKTAQDLHDIEFNIRMGSAIFAQALKRSGGDVPAALAYYNGSYGQDTPYPQKVLAASSEFQVYTKQLKLSESIV